MADRLVQFISKTELNAKKEERRKARERILQQAKAEYERHQQRREKRKATGEDKWMLPSVIHRIANDDESSKKKKRKKEKRAKDKKTKKHKKKSKKEKETSSDSDSDEWVEKVTSNERGTTKPDKMETALPQRDGWMLFPCFGESSKSQHQVKNESDVQDVKEKEQKTSAIDMAGQHSRELNPYWKDGGTGLPTERSGTNQTSSESKTVYDAKWLKKALQRAQEQADEEGCSVEEVVADRWGSLARLQDLIEDAEKRDAQQTQGRIRRHDRVKESLQWKSDDSRLNRREKKDKSKEKYSDVRDDDLRKKRYDYKEKDSSCSVSRDKYDYEKHNKVFQRCSDNDKSHYQERSHRDKISSKSTPQYDRRESRTEKVQEAGFANTFRKSESDLAKSSCKFMKPSDDNLSSLSSIGSSKHSLSSGGWKKKKENERPRVNRIEQAMKKLQENDTDDSDSNSPESDNDNVKSENSRENENIEHADDEKSAVVKTAVPTKKITEVDLNNMGAKILKAELMGNEDFAAELKAKLEEMRTDKEAQELLTSNRQLSNVLKTEEEIVVLTRTDKFGNTRPVTMNEMQEPKGGRRKREKVTTHGDSGQRERYFADDDRYDLNEIVRREKMNTAEDYNDMFSRLASKGASKTDSDDFTLDDHFVSGASKKFSRAQEEEREKMKAIREHQRLSAQLSKCQFCFENPDLAKHLIIAIGIQVYLAVPLHTSLTDGHCLIIPIQHQVAYTYLDEDVVDEIKVFKKGVTRMFLEMEKDVIFLETCRNISRQKHMIIECIPVPKEEGDLAPMYFKKAISESDSEWAHNKKLIDTSKKGLIGSVPKGLPFFSVEFGLDGGFAHIIEEEHLFPHYFGKEIIGGMLDLEPWTWHKPHKENFEQHKKKVLQFADWWKPYDWTKRLKKNK